MVLQEAITQDSSTFSEDGAPSSNPDPYSSSPSGFAIAEPGSQIDVSKLPKPMFILGRLQGFNAEATQRAIIANIARMAVVVRRPLTADECQAVAYYKAKQDSIQSYGLPVGVAGGMYQYRKTRATYRFPFWQPDVALFDANKLGPFRGMQAQMGWNLLRAISYGGVGGAIGALLFQAYATSVAGVGLMRDTRMKDVVNVVAGLGASERSSRLRQGVANPQQSGVYTPGQDEASPSGGGFAMPDTRSAQSNTGVMSDNQMRSRETAMQADTSRRPVGNPENTFAMEKVDSQPGGFDMMDDASPTAGNQAMDSGSSSGNVWERLRQGKTSSAPSSSRGQEGRPYNTPSTSSAWADRRGGANVQGEQSQGSTVGDSYSFSKTDEERQLAKQEAQREFDARVERERRGGGFDENNKKWE